MEAYLKFITKLIDFMSAYIPSQVPLFGFVTSNIWAFIKLPNKIMT